MRTVLSALCLCVLSFTACSNNAETPSASTQFVRVVNGNTAPVDLFIDGTKVLSNVSVASVDSVRYSLGTHTFRVDEVGSSAYGTTQMEVTERAPRTIAALRTGAVLSAAMLDDTNAVVAPGKTKVRVLHLAPNAGEITVMRTQPDYQTPITWQFPFLYSAEISALSNPYVESTSGTWDIRAWRKPSEDALGWNGTTAKVTLSLQSGEKRTVLVLDKAGGGIALKVIE